MSCLMSDDEAFALPRASELSSPIGGSVNVLDMINKDVMFSSFLSPKSNADTQVTYVHKAPTAAPSKVARELFPAMVPTTSQQAYQPPETSSRASYNLDDSPSISTSVNPFEINPFVAGPSTSNLFNWQRSTSGAISKKDSASKSSSSKKSRSKSHSSHKRSSHSSSKSSKTSSRSDSKTKKSSGSSSQKKEMVSTTVSTTAVTTVTHTVTRTTQTITRTANIVTDSATALGRAVTKTATTVIDLCSVTTVTTTVTSNTVTSEKKAAVTEFATVVPTTHTKLRAPVSIISPLRSTYLPTNVLYSTPTIITRSPSAATGAKPCEYTILPAPTTHGASAKGTDSTNAGVSRARTRLVIPITLNALPTLPATTSTVTAACKRRPVQTLRSAQSPNAVPGASAAVGRPLAHSSFALPPGATIYTAKNIPKRTRPAVTTESQTFTIVDSKGAYTTLTISPDFTAAASASRLNQTQTTTATGAVSNTSTTASDTVTRPRSQLLIPIANSQMNINTSLGYLVTSPIAPPATTAVANPTTTIASHTITTISSEQMNRIRSRLIYNVPNTTGGINSLPSSTVAAEGSRPRGPVTIIANQLISAVPRGDSPSNVANPSNRPLNRLVIPIMSNVVHAASTSHNSVASQGAYIIAGVNQATTMANDAASRTSRVVIPIIRNSSGAVAATSTTAAGGGSKPSPAVGTSSPGISDPYSKLRNRLTIQVTDGCTPRTASPITAYTISRTRTPQNVYTIPAGSTPYISMTKASDIVRNPATMTLITFSPPGASGAATAHKPLAPATASPSSADSATMTTTTPPLVSGTNRFVIKLATSVTSAAAASTMTTSATPVTTAIVSTPEHRFAEPHPISTRLRTFPGPRTYSPAQRTASAAVPTTPQRGVARTVTPRIKKVTANPAPLQIFADVVCPPATQAAAPATVTSTAVKPRVTLSQSLGAPTLVMPQYKNAVFKNLSALVQANTERMKSRVAGPRPTPERFVINRSIAFVSPRCVTPEAGVAVVATVAATSAASTSQGPARTPDSRAQNAHTTEAEAASTSATITTTKHTSG